MGTSRHQRPSSWFTGLPGGLRGINGAFSNLGDGGFWWTSTHYSTTNALYRYMYYNFTFVYRDYYKRSSGFSVRCVKD